MARRATSLGPKPSLFSYLFCFCCFFSFPFFASNRQTNPVSPLEKGHLCLFLSVSLCFSLAFFGASPFSIPLSLLLSGSFLFFLIVFLFCFLFVPSFSLFLSFFFFLLCFVSWKEQHQHIWLQLFCFIDLFFCWFPLLFCLSNPFFLIFVFCWF